MRRWHNHALSDRSTKILLILYPIEYNPRITEQILVARLLRVIAHHLAKRGQHCREPSTIDAFRGFQLDEHEDHSDLSEWSRPEPTPNLSKSRSARRSTTI